MLIKIKYKLIIFLAVLLILLSSMPLYNVNALGSRRVIKVGFFPFAGYHDVVNGKRSGYGYDYLHEIAKTTGWAYEYVECTWDSGKIMLANGEIDLLTSAQQPPIDNDPNGLHNKFDFSSFDMGISHAQLTTKAGNTDYLSNDYENFEDIKIGVIRNNSRNAGLANFATSKGFVYTTEEFADQQLLWNALQEGAVDAMLTSNLRMVKNEQVIAQFDPSPFYAIVKDGDTALLDQINSALSYIEISNSYFKFNLFNKHYRSGLLDNFMLTSTERDYFSKNSTVRIAVRPNAPPLSTFTNGVYTGITADIIASLLRGLGLTAEYVECSSYDEAIEMARDGRVDVLNGFESEYNWAEENQLRISTPYLDVFYCAITNKSFNGDVSTVAMTNKMMINDKLIMEKHPEAELKTYKSSYESLKAVSQGTAQIAYVNLYEAEYFMLNFFSNLKSTFVPGEMFVLSLAYGQSTSPILSNVLDRKIVCLSNEEKGEIINKYTMYNVPDFNLLKFIQDNPLVVISLGTVVFIIIVAGLIYVILSNKRHAESVFKLAYVDEMTGMWNRNGFDRESQKIFERSSGQYNVVAVFDISNFSFVNDNYGRSVGDTVINAVGNVIRNCICDTKVIAHDKADHFLVAICSSSINRIREQLALIETTVSAIEVENIKFKLKSNIGVSSYDSRVDFTKTLDNAQTARSESKVSSESIVFFGDKLKNKIDRRNKIIDEMDKALANSNFEVYYQPKFDMRNGKIIGAEALIRWNHSELGFLSPAEFIPILESTGDIVALDFYVLEQVCKLERKWIESGLSPLNISVNQSRLHFQRSDYICQLRQMLVDYKLPDNLIELEITETLFEGGSISSEVIAQMKQSGYMLSMDDFGSGYSSLHLLNQVNVDVLKIDKSLLDDCEKQPKAQKIIKKVFEMAVDLGMDVICEGVETKVQMEMLLAIGCNYAQGYYFSKPLKLEQFITLLNANDKNTESIVIS